MDPLIEQIPESDKALHCPCHANTYEHKKSAHERQAYEYGAPESFPPIEGRVTLGGYFQVEWPNDWAGQVAAAKKLREQVDFAIAAAMAQR